MKLNELGTSANYKKPIGIMELVKFHKKANKEQKQILQKHLNNGNHDEALKLIGKVTNTNLFHQST